MVHTRPFTICITISGRGSSHQSLSLSSVFSEFPNTGYGYPTSSQTSQDYKISQTVCFEDAFYQQVCECPGDLYPTATAASFASSQEKALRPSLETTRDMAAASKIGKILAERLLLKEIPVVSIHLKREQKYHGKVKAVIDCLREAGVKLL